MMDREELKAILSAIILAGYRVNREPDGMPSQHVISATREAEQILSIAGLLP